MIAAPAVYLVELEHPIENPTHPQRFYLGSTKNLKQRLSRHERGEGSKFLAEAKRLGISWRVVAYVEAATPKEAREIEQLIKRQKRNTRLLTHPAVASRVVIVQPE